MKSPTPPRIARRLVRLLLPADEAEYVVGDLDEEFLRYVLPTSGRLKAHAWYWRQVVVTATQMRRRTDEANSGKTRPERGRSTIMINGLGQDVRKTFLSLRRQPGFSAAVLITLGLGIGATTAIFTAVNESMLRPLPFTDPDRLVLLYEANEERGWTQVQVAPANALDWKNRVESFADVAIFSEFTDGLALNTGDGAIEVITSQTDGNMFRVLGVVPLLGRTFLPEETWSGSNPTVLLSYAAWQNYFDSDAAIVGRSISLDGEPYQVIGVTGPDFEYGVTDAEMWTTFRWDEASKTQAWFRRAHLARAVARLAPGVTPEQAAAELATVAHQLQAEHPELNRGMEAGFIPLRDFIVGDRKLPLLLLLGAVTVLQLIAVANVANLMMVRAIAHRHEFALRAALGAGRWRLARQAFTESTVIALVATAIGLAVGAGLLQWMGAVAPDGLREFSLRPDWRILTFSVALALTTAALFGSFPALWSAGSDVREAIGDGSRTGSANSGRVRAFHLVVTVEVALAIVLAAGAALVGRSMQALSRVDPGVEVSHVLTFEFTPPSGSYPTDSRRADLAERFVEELGGIPGVEAAGAVRMLPLTGVAWSSDFTIQGWGANEFGIEVRHSEATPGYFRAMSIPILAGENLPETVAPGNRVPVVVNQAFADRFFPNSTPVGRMIAFDRNADENSYWYPIVGVVGNQRSDPRRDPVPTVIDHIRGDTPGTLRFAVKSSVPELSLVDDVRELLRGIDANIPLVAVRSMEEVAHSALAGERFMLTILGFFGITALILTSVGVYAVSAHTAGARIREIGIRIALGASAGSIQANLMTGGLVSLAIGVSAGIGGTIALSRFLSSILFDVEPTDPLTLGAVAVALVLVTVVSSYLPARRACLMDPAEVLRGE